MPVLSEIMAAFQALWGELVGRQTPWGFSLAGMLVALIGLELIIWAAIRVTGGRSDD